MSKHTCLLILIIQAILVYPAFPQAESYCDSARIDFSHDVQSLIYNDHFAQADSLCGQAISEQPGDPWGYLFKATGRLAEMTGAEENIYGDDFCILLDSLEALSLERIPGGSASERAWMHLCIGHARAFRSLYEARFGSFIKAVRSGMSARAAYQEGLKADSTVYDLYFGLGSYHYWKSARAGLLKWLLLFKNEKEKGIAELQLAADSSVVYADAARSALIWVWLNEGEYDSAIVAAETMRRRYPDGRSFLWPLARACFEDRQYRRALETYRVLRHSLAPGPGNYFNLIECDYQIATCLEKMRQTGEATRVARRLQGYKNLIPDKTRQRQRSKMQYMLRLSRL